MSGPISQSCVKPDDTDADLYGVSPFWFLSRTTLLAGNLDDGSLGVNSEYRLGTSPPRSKFSPSW